MLRIAKKKIRVACLGALFHSKTSTGVVNVSDK